DAELILREKFAQAESPRASRALSDLMVPTVEEGKRALLGAQNTGPTTNEMAQAPVAEDEGIPWRDRPRALPTRRGLLFRHWSIPNAKGRTDGPTAGGTTLACVTLNAPVVGDSGG